MMNIAHLPPTRSALLCVRNALAAFSCVAAVVAVTVAVPAEAAQQSRSRDAATQPDPLTLLDNFVHYALVGNAELAEANARVLLDSGISNADLVQLLDEGRVTPERFDRAISWAQFVPELEHIVSELNMRMEQGRLDLARDPARIEQSIRMLMGTQRERLLAHRRLAEAGEYSVPALLRQLTDGRDQGLRLASQDMIRRIGRQAVSPLVEALPHVGDATVQRIVCDVLGDIGYPHAAPFLLELVMEPSTPSPVRDAARRALSRIGVPAETGLSNVYARLAQQYFDGHESLIAFPDQDSNNIWRYDQFIGLTPTTVPTPIFGHVMSMRLCVRAIEANPSNSDALSLFVAANLKRELNLPQGAVDPIYGDNQYSAAFYATVFGTATCLDVLAMALDRRDTALVRNAIEALAKTTGGSNLFAGSRIHQQVAGGAVRERQPLLEAMFYPDRRAQYEAALTLARALPQEGFSGDYAVVPLLASAVRAGGRLFALVIADDPEDRQVLTNRMEDLGYEVVGGEASVAEVRHAIDHAVGIDVVALHMRSAQRAQQTVNDLRAVPKTSIVPVVILADVVDVPGLRLEYRADSRVEVMRPGLPLENVESGVDALLDRASGGRMTEFEAEEYAIAAVTALRAIAISGTPAFDAADAEHALLDALATRSGGMRLLVADVLAMIGSSRAQRGLFDAALAADGVDQIDLLARVADSVKRHGNNAQDHHLAGLLDLVAHSTGRAAEAAAEVHGALNLPTGTAVGLLPGRENASNARGERAASRR